MTFAQYCILALEHLLDFRHWVATPIYTRYKNKEEENKDRTNRYISETIWQWIRWEEIQAESKCHSLFNSGINLIATFREYHNDQIWWTIFLINAGLASFLQLLRSRRKVMLMSWTSMKNVLLRSLLDHFPKRSKVHYRRQSCLRLDQSVLLQNSDAMSRLAYTPGTFNESLGHFAGGIWPEATLTFINYNSPDFDSCRPEELLVAPISSF